MHATFFGPPLTLITTMMASGLMASAPLPAAIEPIPFAARSGAGAPMGFAAIPPAESGLKNANPYDDPRMWGSLFTEFSAGAIGTGVAVADVDGDGWVDLYVVNKCRPNQLYRQIAPFRFEDVTDRAGVAGPADDAWKTGATFADVNGDGSVDLYVCRFNAPNLLYLNDGRGVFTEAAREAGLDLVSGSVVGAFEDYDRDGWLDVFVAANVLNAKASPDGEVSRLFRNRGDGTFEDVSAASGISREPAHSHSANWFDANGDGWADLYVANDFSAPDFLYQNNGDGTFTDVTDAALPHIPWFSMGSDAADINNDGLFDFIVADMAGTTHFVTGWWNSLAAADLNRDGAIDYIAGNVGLNTKYHANDEHPAQIYYVDFEGTGRPQIIEGKFEGDKLYPVRGRSCSSLAMPSLKEKFPTFNEFAGALLPDIYTPEKLDGSLHLTANELATGVFLNDGGGHFEFQPLPRMAQTAPVFGLAAADFTGDGCPDLFLAQNFHGPQVETGRYDGGLSLLLVGDGHGGFLPMTPAESGIAIGGEGRAAALADWNRDGWPDLLVTRINENVLALTHRGVADGGSFGVALRGPVGNPTAVGARITTRFADGSAEAAEVHAGSGYLAQSEGVAFFGYVPANPPVAIEVVWPDGAQSLYPWKAGVPQMVLTQ